MALAHVASMAMLDIWTFNFLGNSGFSIGHTHTHKVQLVAHRGHQQASSVPRSEPIAPDPTV